GRGALGSPWLFQTKESARVAAAQALQEGESASALAIEKNPADRFRVMIEHARHFESIFGRAHFPRMRKHLGWYCKGFPHAASLRADMFRVSSVADLEQVLADFRMDSASFTGVSDQMMLEPLVSTEPSSTL